MVMVAENKRAPSSTQHQRDAKRRDITGGDQPEVVEESDVSSESKAVKIFIPGINGFIGTHLAKRIIVETDWLILGMDRQLDRIETTKTQELESTGRIHLVTKDLASLDANDHEIKNCVVDCDIIIPLVGVPTPSIFTHIPIYAYNVNFEAVLRIIRLAVVHQKRLIFPSSSEVYGDCPDQVLSVDNSRFYYGPVRESRWIYAGCKQLLERIIVAYGDTNSNFDYTIFRPFNWFGCGLDSLSPSQDELVYPLRDKPDKELDENAMRPVQRVTTQFLRHIKANKRIIVHGTGQQSRSFTYIEDALDALMLILKSRDDTTSGKIYNIGNPKNHVTIASRAQTMIEVAGKFGVTAEAPLFKPAKKLYGEGYADVQGRVPDIRYIQLDLGWEPHWDLVPALEEIVSEALKEGKEDW